MSDRKTKAAKWKRYIADLVHMNTSRLTYKLWSLNNTRPAFRNAQEKAEIKTITAILKTRSKKVQDKVKKETNLKRKRPSRK